MLNIYVIIPVYNAMRYLEKCVESVLNQHCENIYIILVNDGSTDGSAELCNRLASHDQRIKVIHQENHGVSFTRNIGIECVLRMADNTDYIAFLDSDDFWHPEFLNQSYEQILAEQRDIYAFGMITCDQDAKRFSHPCIYDNYAMEGGEKAIWSIRYHFAACLYKVNLLKKWNIRFFEDYKYSEDKYFKMQCSFFANSISFNSQVQYIYRDNSSGAMRRSRSIPPIDYYLPIIDGWLKNDSFINEQSFEGEKRFCAGNTLACVYLLDMAKSHFMQWSSRKLIFETIRKHPHFFALRNLRSIGSDDKNYKNKELLLNYPLIFECKYRAIGVIYFTFRNMLNIPFVRKMHNKRKYPCSKLP